MHQKAVKISSQMQNIIKLHPSFTKKPIGPVHQFLSSRFQSQLLVAFLHVYVVTNQKDAALLTAHITNPFQISLFILLQRLCMMIWKMIQGLTLGLLRHSVRKIQH